MIRNWCRAALGALVFGTAVYIVYFVIERHGFQIDKTTEQSLVVLCAFTGAIIGVNRRYGALLLNDSLDLDDGGNHEERLVCESQPPREERTEPNG